MNNHDARRVPKKVDTTRCRKAHDTKSLWREHNMYLYITEILRLILLPDVCVQHSNKCTKHYADSALVLFLSRGVCRIWAYPLTLRFLVLNTRAVVAAFFFAFHTSNFVSCELYSNVLLTFASCPLSIMYTHTHIVSTYSSDPTYHPCYIQSCPREHHLHSAADDPHAPTKLLNEWHSAGINVHTQ